MKLGQRIDNLRKLDNKITDQEGVLKEMKQLRAKQESMLLKKFDKDAIDGCKGKLGVARIRRAKFPSIKDRRKFDKYVLKHKALDLFQNRLSSKAWQARLDEGDVVPGITVFERIGITVTKRGAR